MSKTPVLIEFFYDVISPYSYLAFEVLCRYQTRWNIDLKLKPFLLSGIMKLSGNSAPATVPNKAVYMYHDLKRLQKYFQVPLFVPSNLMEILFNKGSLKTQRFITAIDMTHPNYTESISRAMWKRLYETHQDITEISSMREAGKSIGMNETVLENTIEMIGNQKTKDRLLQFTTEALNYGAFGAPVIVAHVNGNPEAFFGSDRFELLAHTLGEKWDGPSPMISKL